MTPSELNEWRRSLDMTQLEFSQWLKPSRTPGMISNWENGRSAIPDWLDLAYELWQVRRNMSKGL